MTTTTAQESAVRLDDAGSSGRESEQKGQTSGHRLGWPVGRAFEQRLRQDPRAVRYSFSPLVFVFSFLFPPRPLFRLLFLLFYSCVETACAHGHCGASM